MALQSLGPLWLPGPPLGYTGLPSVGSSLSQLNAASEAFAFVFAAPAAGAISGVYLPVATVTSAPTENHTVSLQSLTGAYPDGTPLISETSLLNTAGMPLLAFDPQYTATLGQLLALVVAAPATNFGNIEIGAFGDSASPLFPYCALNTGSWATSTLGVNLVLRYGTDPYTYHNIENSWGIASVATDSAYSTGSAKDAHGARFRLAAPARAVGAWIWADVDQDLTLKLVNASYTPGGSVLASATISSTGRGGTGAGVHCVPFAAVDLAASTYYRLVLEPTSASNAIIYDHAVTDALVAATLPGGADWHLTVYQSAAWTNYDNGTDGYRRPFVGLKLAAFDDGASSGGMVRSRVFTGY